MKKQFLTVMALGLFLGLSVFFLQSLIKVSDVQAAGPTVVISVFDPGIYKVSTADEFLAKASLIKTGEFIAAVENKSLPFSLVVSDESTGLATIDKLETAVCGGAGKCDSKAFVATYSATGSVSSGMVISVFNPDIYSSELVDNILSEQGVITKGDFITAVDKKILPFNINITDEEKAAKIIAILEEKVCDGAGKCDSKAFVVTYSAGGGSCLGVEYVNDKIYPVADVDTYLSKQGLIKEGDLVNAVKAGSLPFIIANSNQAAVDALETYFCGGAGKCESTALIVKLGDCSGSGSGTGTGSGSGDAPAPEVTDKTQAIAVAVAKKNTMLASFNSCQLTNYTNLENLSKQYVANVRQANASYFSTMAPVTSQFIRDFRAATTDLTRQTLIEAYRNASVSNRSKMYVEQTATFTKFATDYSSAKATFEACR